MPPPHVLVVVLLVLLSGRAANAQDVISCGGFVTFSPQLSGSLQQHNLEIPDLTVVRIQLLNDRGEKKSEGDCSPNGYYFVPVDAGSYKVVPRGLPGWVFTPAEVQITCDQQQCNGGQDVNFELSGIELSGHVEAGPSSPSCKSAAAGTFSGITVTVKAADSNLKVATAQVQDSSFTTGPLLPGKYIISAAHPDWQLSPAQITHTLGISAAQLPTPFRIKGYRLSGSVTSKSGPVSGIQVTLLSTDLESAGCSSSHPPGAANAADLETAMSTTALCSVLTGPDGYSFPGVPCGQYTLQAKHPDTDSTFEVEPSSMTVVVGHGNAVVPEPFTVTGFSVQGRVVDSAGHGVAGVGIRVAGQERASTDLNGRYVLPRMNEGRLDIAASKKHYTFTSLSAVQVTPAAQLLPDITVKSVSVCGRLVYGEARFKVNARRVSLTSSDGAGLTESASADASSAGFCFMVPAGRYRIAPYVSADEKAKGLIFSPSHVDVSVGGEPVLDVVFSQAQLAVSGSVVCLDGPCPGDVHLTLKAAAPGGGAKVVYSARLDEVALKDAANTGNTITFSLPRISPGQYLLSADRPGWCWAPEKGVPVLVEAADVEVEPLKQTGYQLQVSASHSAVLRISGDAAPEPFEVSIEGGRTNLCMPGSGQFTVTPRSCYIFSSGSFDVNIKPSSPPEPLTLQARQVYVTGRVMILPSVDNLPNDITVTAALEGAAASVDAAAAAGLITKATPLDPDNPHLYSYTLAIDLGATIVVTPSVTDDSGLLFYPRSQIFKHDATAVTCPPAIASVEAKKGIFVTGATAPAVEGAEVKVLFKTPSAAAGGAASSIAASGTTDESGSFSLGPLYDDSTYEVQLSKPGHIFSPTGEADSHFTFNSKQLAQVAVTVELPDGADPSAVFLSLSGGGSFKNNARLGVDRTLTFFDLQPGTYYLKPLLREHQFEPPVADLKLADGQAVDVTLTAVRTAWGISGAVTSVGGAPLAGAVVEACQGSGAAGVVLDSAVTDEAGEYRIGNLRADNVYEMRVRLDGRVISAHPAGKQVNLGRGDVSGVDFVAFRTSSRSVLSAALRIPPQLRSAIKAELLPASSGTGGAPAAGVPPASTAVVDGSGFFEMRGLKPGSYVLRLSCDPAAAGGLSCEPWHMPVQVPSKDVHLGVLPYNPSPASSSSNPAASAGLHVSDEGLDWKVPVFVLVLLIAGSATVLKPAISDILQLRATITPVAAGGVPSGFGGGTSGGSAGTGAGTSAGSNRAAARAAERAAAVAAAAAAPLPAFGDGVAAADGADGGDEGSDDDVQVVGMRQRGSAGGRSRSRRA